MRKRTLFLILLISLSLTTYSQCIGDCVTPDLNFSPQTSYDNLHPDWQISHGSPSVSPGQFWMWSRNDRGEGMNYSGYNFIQGEEYCITFEATLNTQSGTAAANNAYFRVAATHGNITGLISYGNGGRPIPPLPATNQIIAQQNWNAAMTTNPNTSTYTYTFVAADNFDNLWFHPASPYQVGSAQVNLAIRNINICHMTDPCETINFSLQLNEQSSANTSISFSSVSIPTGAATEMIIIKNGTLEYNGAPISYLAEPGTYTVCMKVKLADGTACEKCFDFCIEEWISRGQSTETKQGEIIKTEKKLNEVLEFPNALKEKSISETSIRVFPNPTSGKFTIEVDKSLQVTNVTVHNTVSGRSVGQIDLNEDNIQVDISKETTGVYDVTIELINGSIIHEKIILKK